MNNMYICGMENEIIDLYLNNRLGIEELCKKFKVGKLKIKKILSDNNIPLKKKGGQIKNIFTPFNHDKYKNKYLKCKKTGKIIKDTGNKSGFVLTHLSSIYDLPKLSKFKRFNISQTTGLYWYDEYFDLIDSEDVEKEYWYCQLCDYKSIDVTNISGSITKHLNNEHKLSLLEYTKTHPIDTVNLKN